MSSDDKKNNDSFTDFDTEKLKQIGGKFSYYFDIFYRVTKGILGFLLLLLIVGGFLGGGAAIGYFASLVENSPVPTETEMSTQVYDYNQTSTMYYADNSPISDLRSDLFRTPVTLDEISPFIVHAIIATEDENYRTHEGIVPKAIIRAAAQEILNADSTSGGSTLTQQLVKQQILSSEVSHSRKAIEILYAIHLENHFSKDEILEAYLNISPFGRNNLGRNIAGIEEAAQGIFGVSATEVTLSQAAFLAGLPQSPIVYSPFNQDGTVKEDVSAGLNRQEEVLYSMYREGYITKEVYNEALDYDITADFLRPSEEDGFDPTNSYEYDLVEKEAHNILLEQMLEADGITQEELDADPSIYETYYNDAQYNLVNNGYKIYSTIDPALHQTIQQNITNSKNQFGNMRTLTSTNDEGETVTHEFETQVSGTLIDNATGKVLAFVGGRDYAESNFNNAFNSRRPSGSVIKPLIVYGPALAENFITPATVIPDITYTVPDGTHTPKNFGSTTNTWRDARHWLTISQNIPTIRLYVDMLDNGINPQKYFRTMGIGADVTSDEEFYFPSSSLGGFSSGPTATELAGAFAAIGNKGVFNSPYVIERIENANGEVIYEHELNPTRVWSETANYILYDMMRSVTTSGTGTGARASLNFSTDLAGKTGTSDETMDVWFAGITPKVSLVTWMGYGHNDLSLQFYNGMTPPQRNIRNWANIMNTVYSLKPELVGANERFTPPNDNSVTSSSILVETGMKPGEVKLPGGGTFDISGSTRTEMFARNNIPKNTVYDFARGASSKELADFWKKYLEDNAPEEEDEEEEEPDEDEADDEETPTPTPPAQDEADDEAENTEPPAADSDNSDD